MNWKTATYLLSYPQAVGIEEVFEWCRRFQHDKRQQPFKEIERHLPSAEYVTNSILSDRETRESHQVLDVPAPKKRKNLLMCLQFIVSSKWCKGEWKGLTSRRFLVFIISNIQFLSIFLNMWSDLVNWIWIRGLNSSLWDTLAAALTLQFN